MGRARDLLFNDDTAMLELLKTPIRDLPISIERSSTRQAIRRLRAELKARGVRRLKPVFFISNEYGCCVGTSNIGLGFWDFDDRLRLLNKQMRGFLWSRADIMAVLRHEAGHAFTYLYRLYRRSDFRTVFGVRGHFFNSYPKTRRLTPNPWSKDFVNPNRDHYAQRHPDEDFAETFSEWMRTRDWKGAYRDRRGALRKMTYIDELVRELGRRAPPVRNRPSKLHEPMEELQETVEEFLGGSLRPYQRRASGYIDPELERLFGLRGRVPVEAVVARHRRRLEPQIARTAGVLSTTARAILEKISVRSAARRLRVPRESDGLVGVAMLATTLAARYKHRGRFTP